MSMLLLFWSELHFLQYRHLIGFTLELSLDHDICICNNIFSIVLISVNNKGS